MRKMSLPIYLFVFVNLSILHALALKPNELERSKLRGMKSEDLFAGDGLQTYGYTILHHRLINMNCTTYSDCYYLLCSYDYGDIFPVFIVPNERNNDCDQLNSTDIRLLKTEFTVYYKNGNLRNYYETKTVSEASLLLCKLKLDMHIKQIFYFGLKCNFSK